MPSSEMHIAVGLVFNNKGEVLVTRRFSDVSQGGLWEFPGGKRELPEHIRETLARELYEEVGLIVDDARPFIKLHYDYPEEPVILDVWRVIQWRGQVFGREGQPILWADISKLQDMPFPEANGSIVKALKLPSLYLICPDPVGDHEKYLYLVEECIKAGVSLLQLRYRENFIKEHPELIMQILDVCNANDTKLLLNTLPALALSFPVHGIHLTSVRLLQLNQRPLDNNYWVSASCHNLNELEHACKIGVDFIVLSPVEATSSHPEAIPLGWDRFSELVEHSTVPVYALGGMLPSHMYKAWNYGAHGLAMLSGVWLSSNPVNTIRECFNYE